MTAARPLPVEALSAEAFAPFGEVIAAGSARESFAINDGTAQRFHAISRADCASEGGETLISLVRAQPRALPFEVRLLERHPLGSQAFVPLSHGRFLVVVATSPQDAPRAFLASAGQGINFSRGTWHHPLLALDAGTDFLVIDRGGDGENCEEAALGVRWRIGPV